MVCGALSCRLVTNHGYQGATEGNVRPHRGYSLPSARILGPSTIGLVAFLGFNGFCIAVSGPTTLTIPQVSALAAFCLTLAGLCRWICGFPSEAGHTEERFRCFFEYAASPMLIVDSDKRFVYVNHAYSELLGYDTPELLGRPFTMVTHPEDIPEQLVLWDELFRHNTFSSGQDKRYIRKDGRVIWVRVTANLFTASDGTAPLIMSVVENISERRQAESTLRQSEARLIEALPQQVWTARPDGTLDYVNRRVLEYFDAPAERLLDWEWQSVLHPDDLPACMTAWTASLQTGEPYEIEFRLRQGDEGVYRWYLARALPIRDEAGRIVKWIGTNTDISMRRQVEQALRESEERLRVLYEDNPSMYFTVALDGRVLSVNRFGAHQLGYRSEELIGRPVSDVVYEEDQAFVRRSMAQAFTDGMDGITSLEFRKKTKDGTVIWVREQLRILRMGEAGPVALIVCEDISVRKQMEAALAEREEHLRLFIEHSPVALAMFDREMRYLAASRRWRMDCRVGDEPLIGRSHYEIFPEISERWKAIYLRCLTGALEGYEEDSFVRPDGRTDWIRWGIRPWLTAEGDVGGVVIFSEDITARKQADAAIRESEEQFRILADTAPVLIWMSGLDKRVSYFNTRWLEYTGRTMEQERGDGWVEGIHPDDGERCWKTYAEAFDRREPFELEYRLRKADGQYGWLHERGAPRFLPGGTFAGYHGACIDITARKLAEENLQCTRFAMDQAVDAVYWIDPNARILYANEAARAMLGYTEDEFLRMTVHDLNPSFPPEMWPAFWGETRTKKVLSFETLHLTKDGRRIPIDIRVSFLSYGGQEFHCAFVRDVTERKRVDEALLETQERFELAVRATNDGIWDWNIVTGELYWSDHTYDLLNYEPREFVPSLERWRSLLHPEESEQVLEGVRRHLELRMPYDVELRIKTKDGSYRWFRDMGQAVWDANGRPLRMVGSISDVTDRKNAEDALRTAHVELEQRVLERTAQLALANQSLQDEVAERKHVEAAVRDSELRYKLLTEATFDGIAIHDQGILIEVNAGLERMFRYEAGELIGRSILDLVAEESRDMIVVNMGTGVSGPYEAMGRRKDGTTFPGEVVVRPYCYRGKEVRLVAGRDITERKHLEAERVRHTEELERQVAERTAEIAKLESQRAQTEKLAAMGRLAAGVAHEINNPIAGIKNAFTLVKQAVDPAHPHAEFVGMIDREIARVASIVQNMYQLYRPESGKGEAVKLQTMMHDIEALFAKRLQQRRLVLTIDVDSCIDRFCVPRGDLLQVLLNLLNNAIDCSSEGGTITLTLRADADAIWIAVSDQGPGIPPEHLPHIFDPFFTTKTGGDQKGMGLGLSISQSLVMAMGGKIEVQTRPNDGSTFSVILPRHTALAYEQGRSNIIKEVMNP